VGGRAARATDAKNEAEGRTVSAACLFDAMVDWHIRRFPSQPSIERIALKLGEEAGELQSAVLAYATKGDDGKGDVAEELADVLACLAVLARIFGVDLIDAGWDKLAELESRLAGGGRSGRAGRDRIAET
jgi:NTP pyrophosphatase (non-canonical NTP hydrolase)